MEIKSRLKVLNSNEVNAVLLSDGGEVYPVFLKSLHNTIIFPALIESGYSLNSLPYGFIKDGMEFDKLPMEDYSLSEQEIEMMYNSIGVPVSDEELKSHINIAEVKGIETPPTDYTIFTREDFLKYLDSCALAELDTDFMPINYFVAPSARFTLQEYLSDTYDKYVKIMDARREMTLTKFYNLVNALKNFGLPANYTFMDILDLYFAWGMDGLDFVVMNKSRTSSAVRLSANPNKAIPARTSTYGLIDGSRNLLLPKHQRNTPWSCELRTPEEIEDAVAGMQMNDTKVVRFHAAARNNITTLEGPSYNIRYSEEILVMQRRTYPSLRVKSPINVGTFLNTNLALPGNKEALYEDMLLHAIAGMIHKRRVPRVKVSSFDALTASGLNPKTVLRYVTTALNINRSGGSEISDADAICPVDDYAIDAFLAGDWSSVTPDERDVIMSIIDGSLSIGHIGVAKEFDNLSGSSVEAIYSELFTIHFVMGMSCEDILNVVRSAEPNQDFVIFAKDGLQHKISIKPSDAQLRGYLADLREYNVQNAVDCTFFTYVTLVAKEVGTPDATRHIAMEFYFANRTKKKVAAIVDDLVNQLEVRVKNQISDINKQAALLKMKVPFALNRYFEIALNGTITWPKDLGGMTEPVSAELRSTAMSTLERRIESIVAFCDFTANPVSVSNLKFNAYCTNATITPERIIPRSGCTLHEVPFYAAWTDWRSSNPAIWEQLISRGVLDPNFIAWENRYAQEQFVQRGIMDIDREDSLLYYYNHAVEEVNNYPNDKEFIAVEHPIQYLYPGLFMDDEGDTNPYASMPNLPVPRQEDIVIRLGNHRMITEADYIDYLKPNKVSEESTSFIRRFYGFDADTLIAVPDVLEKLPQNGQPLIVRERHQTIFVGDKNEYISYLRINELCDGNYPVVHIYDRIYLLRSADGRLWEVRI